jgi:hypothetical protein
MVLRCECGGSLELTGQSYGEETAFESYECVSCGRTGTYSFGGATDSMSGCVTDDGAY